MEYKFNIGDKVVLKDDKYKVIYKILGIVYLYSGSLKIPQYSIISETGVRSYWYSEKHFESIHSPGMSLLDIMQPERSLQ